MICQEPDMLLLLTTGKIDNIELVELFINNIPRLVELFQEYSFIEMNRSTIIVHQ